MHNTETFNTSLTYLTLLVYLGRPESVGKVEEYIVCEIRVNSMIIQRIAIEETEIDPVQVLICGYKFYILIFGFYQHLLKRTWRKQRQRYR